jgi:hypothetical protein
MPQRITPNRHARYPLCRCDGYRFPHRPGGGDRCTFFEGREVRQREERWRPLVLSRQEEMQLVLERLGLRR